MPADPDGSRSGRVLALDLGTVRIGVAVSDRSRTLASPLTVVRRSGSREREHDAIAALVDEEEAALVLVGVPYSMDGTVGTSAVGALEEIDALRRRLVVPVETIDERLSTVSAHRALAQAGKRAKARRELVDAAAAAVLLQAWLDRG